LPEYTIYAIGVASGFLATLTLVYLIYKDCDKLEKKVENTCDQKSKLIDDAIIKTTEDAINEMKRNNITTLDPTFRQKFTDLASLMGDIDQFSKSVEKIKDQITNSFFAGVIFAIFTIIWGVVYNSVDSGINIVIGLIVVISGFCYLVYGVLQVPDMRKIEKTMNNLRKEKSLDKIEEILSKFYQVGQEQPSK